MDYNPFLPEVQDNPYPYYAHLREHAPVYQVPGVGFWAVSRYEDVLSALKNPQMFSSTIFSSAFTGDLNPWPPEAPPLLDYDPPDHTRLRKLANRAFTPRRVANLERHIREVAYRLIEQIPARGTFDLVSVLAAPLPTIVIAELLGVPPEQQGDFRRWVDIILKASNAMAIPPEEQEQIRQSRNELWTYVQNAIAAYRQQPGDNLISDLVRAEEEEQRLSANEVLSLVVLLIAAGIETTRNLISNATLALCSHPEQMAQVRAIPTLVPKLLEETLRYDGPIQTLFRLAKQDIEITGTTIPTGSFVFLLLGSANHDGRKFPEPGRFDILRNTEGHVGFGFGIHFCLGAELARLEAKVAMEVLLERVSHLARTEDTITRVESLIVRGPKMLPLMVG